MQKIRYILTLLLHALVTLFACQAIEIQDEALQNIVISQEGYEVHFMPIKDENYITEALVVKKVNKGEKKVKQIYKVSVRSNKDYILHYPTQSDIKVFIYPKKGDPKYAWVSETSLKGGADPVAIGITTFGLCCFAQGCVAEHDIECGNCIGFGLRRLTPLHCNHLCAYRGNTCKTLRCCCMWGIFSPLLYTLSGLYNCCAAYSSCCVDPCERSYQIRKQALIPK